MACLVLRVVIEAQGSSSTIVALEINAFVLFLHLGHVLELSEDQDAVLYESLREGRPLFLLESLGKVEVQY